jgi:hypothetical protein
METKGEQSQLQKSRKHETTTIWNAKEHLWFLPDLAISKR